MAMTYGSKGRSQWPDRGRKREPDRWSGLFWRLMTAVFVFLICLVGKTQFPDQTAEYQKELATMLSSTTDFRSAFTDLGQELAEGSDMLGAVGDWCVTVFAAGEITLARKMPPEVKTVQQQERQYFISWDGDKAELQAHLLPRDK